MSTDWRRLPARAQPTEGGLSIRTKALIAAATGALGARFLASVVVNVPSTPGNAPVDPLATAAMALAAVGIVTLGTDITPSAGVGLLFAGVFGLLGTFVPVMTLPAALAVTVGTVVFVAVSVRETDRSNGAVLALFAVALFASLLGGVTGAVAVRPYTSLLSFVALGTLPVLVATDSRSLVRAGVAVTVVVGIGLTLPFVTGAVTLVGTGAVGASLPAIAVAVAGVVTAASAALRQEQWLLAAGVALVALAGVPATLPRAVPFALGVATLAMGVDR